ncbi:hypothetical protein [Paenibacillus sp. LHD-38]|uniref:hypothetical protein n=1 Tax=Paenibacillus sp. LHD-38 TaxID=3072143 RepID=UPI00280FD0DE|nr:hypothetical protein [Paenibacillus sp. LHD-38]MDQ8739256.1 hypothetical protein [Paenibacillus sp. LHD-38]
MNRNYNMGNVGSMNQADFCPDCPTQTIYDPPITQYEDYYHPQLVNVIQNIETVKQHHCCPVYQHYYTHTEKNVMVSSVKSGKQVKASSSKKRSKK